MLAYYRWHPSVQGVMVKQAASNALARFFMGWRRGNKGVALQPSIASRLKRFASNNKLGIAGTIAGAAGGIYLGNEAYKNAIPPVRSLPLLGQEPYINTPQAWQTQETYGY